MKRKGVSISHNAGAGDDDDDMDVSDPEGDVTKTCEDTREDANDGEGALLVLLVGFARFALWNCFYMNVYREGHVAKW